MTFRIVFRNAFDVPHPLGVAEIAVENNTDRMECCRSGKFITAVGAEGDPCAVVGVPDGTVDAVAERFV